MYWNIIFILEYKDIIFGCGIGNKGKGVYFRVIKVVGWGNKNIGKILMRSIWGGEGVYC